MAYAAINYKDALACTPNGHVAVAATLVPGLEMTGIVVDSTDPRFSVGERVLANDFGSTLGIARHGGFSEYARVPGDFLVSLPTWVDDRHAHLLTGGMTVIMGLHELEKYGLTPQRGPVIVTGATGGVGSMAVSLLAQRGYTVVASTGKADAQAYLRRLGAHEVLSRAETEAQSNRPLDMQRWAGSFDMVGGATLAYLMRTTQRGGAIAAIGVAGGAAFQSTVFPFILRGIKVVGIDMPSTSIAQGRALWEELSRKGAIPPLVEGLITEVTLDDLSHVTRAMLAGQTQGRILVKMSA